ncbi:NAD-glutamate dehydrogenase [Devosia pacifica]|uniref:NAD-glutamate dehydrogenase n=1 Tax=Devosia pacifica TaxID=1335967 RepID=A0A918SE41_9HYPH|nr:NAD-glutamate dehydrogenase [Devosia pacifica]GHA34404.1 NAD-glutamate dehydrogenase [Devosia pacifica]
MPDSIKDAREQMASRIATLTEVDTDNAALLDAALASIDEDDLKSADPDALIDRLKRSFDIARTEEVGAVRVSPDSSGTMVVSVVSRDMPFIVDSILASIREIGGTIRLFAHPRVFESQDGTLTAKPHEGAEALSIMHVEIDPIAEEARLVSEIEATLADVRLAVADWEPMQARARSLARDIEKRAGRDTANAEAAALLDWLTENNFTFIGLREYTISEADSSPLPESGLGILRDPDLKFLRSGTDFVEFTPEHEAFIRNAAPVTVNKANIRSRVHRRVHLDYVVIKLVDGDGKVSGEVRLLGLFTAQAVAAPHTDVPIIRQKILEVMRRSQLNPESHARRALLGALMSYPRDELFQIDTGLLAEYGAAIAALYDRPRVRVLPRIDRFDNFVSILVYVPRDRYDAHIRAAILNELAEQYDGRVSAFYPNYLEGELVRVHVIIGRNGGDTPTPSRSALEERVEKISRGFGERLMAATKNPASAARFREGFSQAYQSRNSVEDALADIERFESLSDGASLAIALNRTSEVPDGVRLRFYHLGSAIPLSDRVPMLEQFGFRVIEERTYTVRATDEAVRYIHDMVLVSPLSGEADVEALFTVLESALLAVWSDATESDGLNALTVLERLEWPDVALLRALSRYLRQVGISYSQRYLAQVLNTHSDAAAAVVSLFHALHDPDRADGAEAEEARKRIEAARDAASSIDEDRILARFANLVEASLRTNFFQRGKTGEQRPALAIKFDSSLVEAMPAPRPFREIFVYSPRVEGIHLRFGAIARGGLRWSDRPEDFRTEVLGLVKAQQVKNAVIVPVGAKGGFVPKHLTTDMAREARQAEGTACYKIFIGALLDITDNRVGADIEAPERVIRRDGDDPYLVVAADKGTASFSDTANAIAVSRGFWLGDAFASGGSAGYDHKEMGITARGAWECVRRHFREMDRDIQTEPFTVAGVGDMSGDVFGNGMLLSEEIRLVAAFDHRDIFLDPDPDAAASIAERRRLFQLPRSSWQDYDKSLISPMGGVFSRSAKSIPLNDRLRDLLGLEGEAATPTAIMSAILSLNVDLLWFGGIGTYVRARSESNADVGDRANDAIRVSADKVRALVIGEGANLGITQRGRIEYALKGGRINTDAIDNSAGVNSSDLEVNIKIALRPVQEAGRLEDGQRNAFLAEMTEAVAQLCLRNNYLQSLAISLADRAGLSELPDLRDLMCTLEERGLLDRGVEFLPSEQEIDDRAANGQALTRPELAVLLAYAKLTYYADLLESDAPDDPYLTGEMLRYFPDQLAATYPDAVEHHRLRREVVATVLSNAIINRGGPAVVDELRAATSAGPGDVARAYVATRDTYGLTDLNSAIDALDGAISGTLQLELYAEVEALMRREALWFLRNAALAGDTRSIVARHREGVVTVSNLLAELMPAEVAERRARHIERLAAGGVPEALAQRIADLPMIAHASDVVLVSDRSGASLPDAAQAYFGIVTLFNLTGVGENARQLVLLDRYDRMALDRALANLTRAQRELAADVLATGGSSVADKLLAWQQGRADAVSRTVSAVSELTRGTLTVSRLSVAAGLLTDIAGGS